MSTNRIVPESSASRTLPVRENVAARLLMQPLPIPSGTGFVMADPPRFTVQIVTLTAVSTVAETFAQSHGRTSEQPSHYRENLANYLSIAIPELISPVDSARIRVNHQTAVLPAAAPAQVGPITFENDVQRLLP